MTLTPVTLLTETLEEPVDTTATSKNKNGQKRVLQGQFSDTKRTVSAQKSELAGLSPVNDLFFDSIGKLEGSYSVYAGQKTATLGQHHVVDQKIRDSSHLIDFSDLALAAPSNRSKIDFDLAPVRELVQDSWDDVHALTVAWTTVKASKKAAQKIVEKVAAETIHHIGPLVCEQESDTVHCPKLMHYIESYVTPTISLQKLDSLDPGTREKVVAHYEKELNMPRENTEALLADLIEMGVIPLNKQTKRSVNNIIESEEQKTHSQ